VSKIVLGGLARILMTMRNGNITYSQTSGHPACRAIRKSTNVLGMDNFTAPGFGFITGQQNHDLSGRWSGTSPPQRRNEGWLVQTPVHLQPVHEHAHRDHQWRLSLEPFKGMRVELMANRTKHGEPQLLLPVERPGQRYVNDSPREFGSFSVSMHQLVHGLQPGTMTTS
jgi:cell surface protein SprA